MAEQYNRNPNTQCFICKKPIYKRPGILKASKNRVFCSPDCYGKSLRKEIPCLVCGKLILSGLNKKTCSRSCANSRRVGVKYKVGRPKDKAETIRLIKLELINLRGGKCERCDYKKVPVLQVHHKDRNPQNNKLGNLELICPNCHYEEHYLEKAL